MPNSSNIRRRYHLTRSGFILPNLIYNVGGFGRMITLLNAYQSAAQAAGREILRVHAGDMITGTLYYTLLGYPPDAAVMNAAGFDAVTLGNHGKSCH